MYYKQDYIKKVVDLQVQKLLNAKKQAILASKH